MSNFKFKRTAEHPNETTTGSISLSEHIADPDAHRVVVNVPTSQQINLTINDKDELKSLLDSWYAQIGHTHATQLSPEDIGKIVDSLNESMLQTLKNYALKNHDHDGRYLKKDDVDTEIEDYLSKLNIADTILSELSLNTKLPEQNSDTYATRDGVSAYLPGKNIVYVNNLTDFGNYCLTSYKKYPVFTGSVGTATIDKYSVYKDLETNDYVGLDSIVDFTTDFCGLLNVYRTKYTENEETYYLVIQKLSFMQNNGECIEAIRYGTVQGTLSILPEQIISQDDTASTVTYIYLKEEKSLANDFGGVLPENTPEAQYTVSGDVVTVSHITTSSKESLIECRDVPWNPWKVTNEKPVIPEYSELDITKAPSSEIVDRPITSNESNAVVLGVPITTNVKYIVVVVSSTKNIDVKVGMGPYLPLHGWFSINVSEYADTQAGIAVYLKVHNDSETFTSSDTYSVYYYKE